MSIPAKATLREVLQAIDKGALGIALLVDENDRSFKGVITDGDIRRALLKGYGLETNAEKITRPESITAHIGTPMHAISALLSDRIRVIPLLDDRNRVVDLALLDRRVHLPVAEPTLGERELQYVNECILTGWISSTGRFVSRFEEIFAAFCGVRNAVATSNGTAALHLALLACGIGNGDEVIVPSLTFIATANAVTYTGAKPVFVDSEWETWNIDPQKIEQAITARTKAIIPVHLYGHPANMGPIMEIARRRNLSVIEDAAEAHGAHYQGAKVGSVGDLGVFSFYGNKIVTTGEGGMVVTNNSDFAEKMRVMRDHGMDKARRYWHPVLGYNYRLTNIQAALGVAQMEKIDLILSKKRDLARLYEDKLHDIPGLRVPTEAPWAKNVFWLYSILIDEQAFGMSRNALMGKLHKLGIDTRPIFPPVHMQPIYVTGQHLPVAESISARGFSLPSSVKLSPEDVVRVAQAIADLHTGTR